MSSLPDIAFSRIWWSNYRINMIKLINQNNPSLLRIYYGFNDFSSSAIKENFVKNYHLLSNSCGWYRCKLDYRRNDDLLQEQQTFGDIALIQVTESFDLTLDNIGAICLPMIGGEFMDTQHSIKLLGKSNSSAIVHGWGNTRKKFIL